MGEGRWGIDCYIFRSVVSPLLNCGYLDIGHSGNIYIMKFGKCYQIKAMIFWGVGLPAHEVLEVSSMAFFLDLLRLTVPGIWWYSIHI